MSKKKHKIFVKFFNITKMCLTRTAALCIISFVLNKYADVAHLVERHLAKVEVASSSLVIRSIFL